MRLSANAFHFLWVQISNELPFVHNMSARHVFVSVALMATILVQDNIV